VLFRSTPAATATTDRDDDRIVVTGSRIRRSEFTSIAPVQIISGAVSRDIGLVDPAVILQDSTVTAGQQIDGSFAGFVLDNGPGSSTVDLRGLGAARSLVLINGRRMAPAGVEGAPFAPSINLIPGSIVERYEILLDGASSVYGSDAVAGVVNVVLQSDFDGLELNFFRSQPVSSGGESTNFQAKWGINSDRGFAAFALEVTHDDAQKRRDRDWSDQCTKDIELDENGDLRTLIQPTTNPLVPVSECIASRTVGRVNNVPFLGVVYSAPQNNFLAPNGAFHPGFSESNYSSFNGVTVGVDADHDGVNDVLFADFTQNGNQEWLDGDITPEVDRMSFFSFGEFQTDVLGDATFYYEGMFASVRGNQQGTGSGGAGQLFPFVPGSNPYNICNPDGYGVDCGLAFDAFILSAGYSDVYEGLSGVPTSGSTYGTAGAIGAQEVRPVIRVIGDRNRTEFDIGQTRAVAGFRGDLPFVNFGPVNDWTYDVSASFSRSVGNSSRKGIREDYLMYSLETSAIDPSTNTVVCGEDVDGDGIPDGFDRIGAACVPVNLFAPSLYNGGEAGDFATQAERDYVFGDRSFETIYEQTIVSAYANGNLFRLPAGDVPLVIGFEYRMDEIESNASDVASRGLLFGFFQDGGASGSKDLYEAFAEIELPIFSGQPLAEELTFNLSTRWTEEQFYGSAWTYSGKVGYRPVDWALFRATVGTSYRAPNVREQFLLAQSGFNNGLADPCLVPEPAYQGGVYLPNEDNRDAQTIANCIADGIDPTTFGVDTNTNLPNGTGTVSVEVLTGGSTDIRAETSDSFSAGFVLEQPFSDAFELTFGATWWKIEIEDAIVEPGSAFIVNDCYVLEPNLSSAFCSRIVRDSTTRALTLINSAPINLNSDIREGVDINVLFEDDYTVFGRNMGVTVDLRATNTIEASTLLIGDLGQEDTDDRTDSLGFNDWTGQATVRAAFDDFRVTWNTRFIGEAEQFDEGIDAFGNGATCSPAIGDVQCRDYAIIDDYFRHDVSVGYSHDTFDIVIGVRNVFDQDPPMVNSNEVTTNVNAPVGYGYDLQGRRVFVSLSKRF